MNIPVERVPQMSMERVFRFNNFLLEMVFGNCESLMSYDTLQFDDYSAYLADMFDPEAKRKRHEEVFPEDCRKAYDLGMRMCEPLHDKGDENHETS
jgi:hypothetical protein